MTVVVLALGLGLHLQFNMTGQTALMTALAVWTALLVMHLAVRRAHRALTGTTSSSAPEEKAPLDVRRVSASVSPPRQPRATTHEEASERPKPPPLPPSAHASAARQGLSEPRHSPLLDGLRGSPDIQPPRPLPEVRTEERRLPPEMTGWNLRPGVRQEPLASGPRPAVFPPMEQPPAAAARKDAPAAPARFARGIEPSLDGLSPLAQPNTTARPHMQVDQPAHGSSATTADARTAELRSMQAIIEQLAKQLKAPADPAPEVAAGMSEAQAGTEQAIARSVEALKAAGGAMRAAQAGQSAPRQEPMSAAAASHAGTLSIAEALTSEALEVYLDSILSLEDRKTRHFEISVRIKIGGGEPVAIDDYALIQAGGGLRGRLDASKLTRVTRIAEPLSKRGLSASLFVSLAAESLVDDNFLDACANVLKHQPDIVRQLVLSFSQSELRSFTKPHWETLATLKENGLRFGLERLADLAMDFAILRERGFHFAKIDAGVLLAGMQAHDGAVSALQVCRRLGDAGLDLIVGHIDDDATLTQIGGLGVLYGQGTFFGVPRPVKIDLKGPREAAA